MTQLIVLICLRLLAALNDGDGAWHRYGHTNAQKLLIEHERSVGDNDEGVAISIR